MTDTTYALQVSSVQKTVNGPAFKRLAYKIHCGQGAMAYDSDGGKRPLSECDINDVKFVGGLWRIQNKFEYKIQIVRGEEFVLGDRINRTEKNLFEFYNAQMVGKNCYGRFIVNGANWVVAKYKTDRDTYWAYGSTLEQARAFLGIRLYDEYRDLIHSVACKNENLEK